MHTAIILTVGLVLLGCTLFFGQRLGISRQTLGFGFLGMWLLATIVNGAIGVIIAHQSMISELVIAIAVFGLPAIAMALFMLLDKA
ncbi:hypothetical protein [Pseudomonas gingeri]|uniref:hypothetical protein n=1 Tax=Pseudomonas gingeri TaxID=117681 RepID=UPI0015A36DDD|nr:hypothetical protein [Pseudomonas gingeri]NWA01227.1 hypothetical protein [Pseudomonas gingeri]NWA17563.1 hypothetical protein [Pseudomonas gingeri]NWA57000.1 hypothetical protein [Pseudomonas gingeri]NWA97055.1 hypothetical protein [Pseudomonas gingeri]NWB05413.1 hypothetical protein [Pseudomonas gingeri]